MTYRFEIYREPYNVEGGSSEFKLTLLQAIESTELSIATFWCMDFLRYHLGFADLSRDDLTVADIVYSDPTGLKWEVKEESLDKLQQYLESGVLDFVPVTFYDTRVWHKVVYIIKCEVLDED